MQRGQPFILDVHARRFIFVVRHVADSLFADVGKAGDRVQVMRKLVEGGAWLTAGYEAKHRRLSHASIHCLHVHHLNYRQAGLMTLELAIPALPLQVSR